MADHALTVRLDDRHVDLLSRVAQERGISRVEVLRRGLEREAAALDRERNFGQLVDGLLDENREALDQLA